MVSTKGSRRFCLHAITLVILTVFSASVASPTCLNHISVIGVNENDVTAEGDTIIINYEVRKREIFDSNRRYLYKIRWDEDLKPSTFSMDVAFSKFFRIGRRNNTWAIFPKFSQRSRPPRSDVVQLRSTFGPFTDVLTCTVIFRHNFTGWKEGLSSSTNFSIISKFDSTSTEETARRDFVIDSGGGSLMNKNHTLTTSSVKGGKKESVRVDFERRMAKTTTQFTDDAHTKSHLPSFEQDPKYGLPEQQDLKDILLEESNVTSSTMTTTGGGGSNEEFKYQITVGIIGGFLGLVIIIAIGVGIYYNHKKVAKLGIFRHRKKQKKTISILGSAYPNVAMSNTDVRANGTETDAPTTITTATSYPNYAYGDPDLTEQLPPTYNERMI